MPGTESLDFCLVDEFAHLSFSCAIEPRRLANLVSGAPLCEWGLASENGDTALGNSGMVVRVHGGFGRPVRADRLLVISGSNMRNRMSRSLLSALRRERSHGSGSAHCAQRPESWPVPACGRRDAVARG